MAESDTKCVVEEWSNYQCHGMNAEALLKCNFVESFLVCKILGGNVC